MEHLLHRLYGVDAPGGVRPIAIGYTLRRIAAKCANSFAASRLEDHFSPIQLCVRTPGGCEATVHATIRYIEAMPDSYVVVTNNNAFNSLHRDLMLQSVASAVPGISRFVTSPIVNHPSLSLRPEQSWQGRSTPRRPAGSVLVLSLHTPASITPQVRVGRWFHG